MAFINTSFWLSGFLTHSDASIRGLLHPSSFFLAAYCWIVSGPSLGLAIISWNSTSYFSCFVGKWYPQNGQSWTWIGRIRPQPPFSISHSFSGAGPPPLPVLWNRYHFRSSSYRPSFSKLAPMSSSRNSPFLDGCGRLARPIDCRNFVMLIVE